MSNCIPALTASDNALNAVLILCISTAAPPVMGATTMNMSPPVSALLCRDAMGLSFLPGGWPVLHMVHPPGG
jgi:hypothetical protein